MKLYTEEQVKQIWKAGQEYWKTSGISITLEELLEQLTPISLPSDEEIEKQMRLIETGWGQMIYGSGAKWMRNQILNKNK